MQSANFRPVDRHFGVVSKIFDDGACSIRRLDGQGEVMLDARHARRVGRDLLVGMRLEFEVKYVHGAGEDRAMFACTVEDGARRLSVMA
jgi:hypothetical protein